MPDHIASTSFSAGLLFVFQCDLLRDNLHSVLKEINTEYSLEGLMLKLQYFGHLMRTGKDFDAGKD